MKAPLRFKSALLIFMLGAAGSVSAAPIVADFTNGNTTAFPDGYVGSIGAGWSSAWSSGGNRLSGASGTVTNTNPLNGGGNYLFATLSTTSGTTGTGNAQGTVQRQIDTGAGSFVDISQPITISFDFRPETNLTSVQNYTIFGSTSNFKGTGPVNTWIISGNSGTGNWTFGNASAVNTGISVVMGTVYSFTLVIDPTTQSYLASITDGISSFTTGTAVSFRNVDAVDAGQYINFGGKINNGGANGSIAFSLDNLTIVPEPSTVALFGMASVTIGLAAMRRRRLVS